MLDKEQVIKLTLVLYKMTENFPDKEPLKQSLREKANLILESYFLKQNFDLKDQRKTINSLAKRALLDIKQQKDFLLSVKASPLANQAYLEVIFKAYGDLIDFFQIQEQGQGESKPKKRKAENNSTVILKEKVRHLKIIKLLKQGKTLQVGDLVKHFPKLSKRTLRRDFEYLVKQGVVKRVGGNSATEYVLRG